MPRPDARIPLLDAAEKLFAVRGIASVSDRQVAEAAGNSNHSAVRYYFGGRAGLLTALLARHDDLVGPVMAERFARSASLLDDVRALVLPQMEIYSALPVPSWRARFLRQLLTDPSAAEVLSTSPQRFVSATEIVESVVKRLADLDYDVVVGRTKVAVHLIATVAAQIEERSENQGDAPDWHGAGVFLCDALTGMFQAPITPLAP